MGLLDNVPAEKLDELRKRATIEPAPTGNEEMDRIFREDAIRTFSSEHFRRQEVECLYVAYNNIQDYHQGLGFTAAFLLLFLSRVDAVTIILYLNDMLKGYFKIHNEAYLRDCRVFDRLLGARDPQLHRHLQMFTVSGQYCSKWFIGNLVHVMPFKAIVRWFALLLRQGEFHIFRLALSIMERNREMLLATSQAEKITQRLRFDRKAFKDGDVCTEAFAIESGVDLAEPGSFYLDMIEHTMNVDVDEDHVRQLRVEIEEQIREYNEKRLRELADLSDDEIVFSDEEVPVETDVEEPQAENEPKAEPEAQLEKQPTTEAAAKVGAENVQSASTPKEAAEQTSAEEQVRV